MSREFNVGRTMTQNYSSVIGKPEPVAHPLNCNAECPYGKGRSFCFPCMAKMNSPAIFPIMSVHWTGKADGTEVCSLSS